MKPIFIFSLPRSGSTLLQRILARSGQISTASEPWLLLPFAYTMKPEGIRSAYGHALSVQAIHDFYKQFPNGRQDYLDELREFILKLYKKNSQPGHSYFLDKTPRYHLIVNEIFEIFPDAKFIFLWRNPLAIVSSIIKSWCHEKWKPTVWHLDLYEGITNLITAYTNNCDHAYSLTYENLIQSPSVEIKKLCGYLSIDFKQEMIDDFHHSTLVGNLGDKTGIKKYASLSNNSLYEWQNTYSNPLRRNWALNYLEWLGKENLRIIGYNHQDLISKVTQNKTFHFHEMIHDLIRSNLFPTFYYLSTYNKNHPAHFKYYYQ